MKSLVKAKPVQVLLSEDDLAALDKAVLQIKRARKDATVGRGTLLREYGMAGVRDLIAIKTEGVAA